MHRIAVEVMHWMSDRQFADMFAIAQVSPGPNVIIVALIGYHVAGFAGAAVATTAMCGPTCLLAFFVARIWDRFKDAHWRIAIQAGLVPLSLGLIAASAFVLARTADHNVYAGLITAVHRGGGVLHPHQSALDVCGGRRAGPERVALSEEPAAIAPPSGSERIMCYWINCLMSIDIIRNMSGGARCPRLQSPRTGAVFGSRFAVHGISTAAWC